MMGHATMNHSMMGHATMNHSMMGHTTMNHSMMGHTMKPMMDHSNHSMTNNIDHSAHGSHMTSSHDMMNMMMYFHTGVMETVLFEDCMTKTKGGMAAACIIVFVVAILYEGLKFLREVLLQRSLMAQAPHVYMDSKTSGISQEQIVIQTGNMSTTSRMFSVAHIQQTVLHVIQVFISYCLMLVFMTYNVWLCMAVVLGAGFGYFLFGWRRAMVVDANEHCH